LLAALTTPARQSTTLAFVPLVALLLAQLLPMQQAAAKPKARLLVQLRALVRATSQALQAAATDTQHQLIASLNGDGSKFLKPLGFHPRVAFCFSAPLRAHPRKGCYV
jgi:hypothetical protein